MAGCRNIKTLVEMLGHQRFDYFPQGALQIGKVLSSEQNASITIAENLLISYPSLTVFYVNINNLLLAERLEYGLNIAIQDSSFDTLFKNHPLSVNALENLQLPNKNTLYLCNSQLPKWVPLDEEQYWLRPWPDQIIRCSTPTTR